MKLHDKYSQLRMWLNQWVGQYPRWGYRRAWVKAQEEGFNVGHDVVRRLCRQEGLRVMPRKRRKRVVLSDPTPRVSPAQAPDDVRALDFQFDSDYQGKAFKVCSIIGEYTREHIGFFMDRSVDATKVTELLDLTACVHGRRPRVLRMDNGPEFISGVFAAWAGEDETMQAFIPPGQPWHNGFVESLHNRMRDELFEQECFDGVAHARQCLKLWSTRYNTYHPHSSLGFIPPEEYRRQYSLEAT